MSPPHPHESGGDDGCESIRSTYWPGQGDWEAKDDTFGPGQTFATGFDQSHSGSLRYIDDDEAVTIELSTDEQGGDQPSCVAFGTFLAGPHAVDASAASRR
jgi:hypothetical protein